VGRSRGGITTKIHARVDALGNPLEISLTAGNANDCTEAPRILATAQAKAIIGDKGYDSNELISLIEERGMQVVIPPRKHRKIQRSLDKELYKERNLIERFFNRLKQYRGLATRYEKTSVSFLAMIHVACVRIWLL
jgi:putative transposase